MPSFGAAYQEEIVSKNSKVKDEKKVLDNIQNRVIAAEGVLKEYQKKEKELVRIEGSIKKAKDELAVIEDNTTQAEKHYESLVEKESSKIPVLGEKVRSLEMEIEKLELIKENMISDLSKRRGEIDVHIAGKLKQIQELEQYLSNLKKTISSSESEVVAVSNVLESKKSEVGEYQKKIEIISSKLVDIEELDKKEKLLHKSIDSLVKSFSSKKRELEKLDISIKRIEENIRQDVNEAEKHCEVRRKELDQREGDLNNREKWLMNKTEKLKMAKSELEEHFNRKINVIF